ncbi:hypothetical protein [Cellulomonas sp. KRMCY2]|uniref:hypothetical protein n=1 Tax=Cellulomonas sp. KRMCY2 TaxID=1304865 RepID=UPI0004AFEABD|nr:hypothetical protein [Cellulomonas sp. KRMCY2]
MTETPSTAEDRALDALTKILESAIAPDMLEAQQLILRRLALAGDLFPARVPPPLNITEVGGYLNLVKDDPILTAQVLAATLGVAGPNPAPGFDPTLPPLYYVTQPNDRPPGPAQTATPVQLTVRSDFAPSFTAALAALHAAGTTLPVLATNRPLPPVVLGVPGPTDLLPYLGRSLDLVPGAALVDPTTDPLAVGQEGGAGPQVVVTRQLDATAPAAATITSAAWSMWTCDATACTQSTVTDAFAPLGPVLNAAGWYQATPLAAPTSLGQPGSWAHWTNVTSLVAGVSTVGDELRLLHSAGVIAASSVRERLDWVWDGTAFVAPA